MLCTKRLLWCVALRTARCCTSQPVDCACELAAAPAAVATMPVPQCQGRPVLHCGRPGLRGGRYRVSGPHVGLRDQWPAWVAAGACVAAADAASCRSDVRLPLQRALERPGMHECHANMLHSLPLLGIGGCARPGTPRDTAQMNSGRCVCVASSVAEATVALPH
eukprot:jgi/Ulvmu1/8171/UM040_0068.1